MQTTVSDYLITRLTELGIQDFFGLPGDYNFNLLKAVARHANAQWINCTNELNAGYAADGYARVKGFGAVITTFGVGELSAFNAIAGAYAENVPVIQIVGAPRTTSIEKNSIIHHNFHSPNYYAFQKAYSNIVETTAFLDKMNAKSEIDRVLEIFVKTRKPVYIAVPIDICTQMIDVEIPAIELKSDTYNLIAALEHIALIVNEAKKPLLLVDYIVNRYSVSNLVNELIDKVKIPAATFLFGKSCVDESNETFIGTYYGNIANKATQGYIENSDCIITIGGTYSDFNTAGFSFKKISSYKIEIQNNHTIVDETKYDNVWIADILEGLKDTVAIRTDNCSRQFGYASPDYSNNIELKQDNVFPIIQNFLCENDLLVIETGSIGYPCGLLKLPHGCKYLSALMWASIGWATPAVFGAAIADRSKRPILFTGDGAHQLTFQEMANIFKYKINPIILLFNNNGYTIERILSNDPLDEFNEITDWDYSKISELFNAQCRHTKVTTIFELRDALKKAETEQKNTLCCIEIILDKLDVSNITLQAVNSARQNLLKRESE